MTHRVVESTSELSALMKAGVMAGSERDGDFCSGGDEDDMSGLHSPSASEDSVEVQVTPISLRNKRKLAEPRKIQEQNMAPLKKRRFERIEETVAVDEEECRTARSPSPFRPWDSSGKSDSKMLQSAVFPSPSNAPLSSVNSSVASKQTTDDLHVQEEEYDPEDDRVRGDSGEQRNALEIREIGEANEPEIREDASQRLAESAQMRLTRIERRETCSRQRLDAATVSSVPTSTLPTTLSTTSPTMSPAVHSRLQEEPLALVLRGEEVAGRVPSHPAVNGSYERTCSYSVEHTLSSSSSSSSSFSSLSSLLNPHRDRRSGSINVCGSSSSTTTTMTTMATATTATTTVANASPQTGHSRQPPTAAGQQRNYKNMTRERRIEANARERTRVHTISAAFDTLRRAIPAYSHNQKLSKLSVLRIACSYIMTLGKIVNTPEGEATNSASLGACVDLVSRTIQTEGKLRKRKED